MISNIVHFKDYYLKISEEFVKPKLVLLSKSHSYHNWNHTDKVAKAAFEIGQEEGLNEENLYLVQISALFHDIGHIVKYVGHEEESIKILEKFMKESKLAFTKENILICKENIMSTNLNYQAKHTKFTKSQKVLMDADMYTVGSTSFYYDQLNLKLEWKTNKNAPEYGQAFLNDEKLWTASQIEFLENHKWHTEYAKKSFKIQQNKNLALFKKN